MTAHLFQKFQKNGTFGFTSQTDADVFGHIMSMNGAAGTTAGASAAEKLQTSQQQKLYFIAQSGRVDEYALSLNNKLGYDLINLKLSLSDKKKKLNAKLLDGLKKESSDFKLLFTTEMIENICKFNWMVEEFKMIK